MAVYDFDSQLTLVGNHFNGLAWLGPKGHLEDKAGDLFLG
jgi:hypothetical protein